MTKPRQKPLLAKVPNKKTNSIGPNIEFLEDDSWVIVKKQIVRILVPPLTAKKQLSLLNSEPNQLQAMATEPASSGLLLPNQETSFQEHIQMQPSSPKETCLKINGTNQAEKPLFLAPKLDVPTARRSPRPITTIQKLSKKGKHAKMDSLKDHYVSTLHSRSKLNKPTFSFLGGGMFLSQRMRASILEKKLQRSGGLSRWLASMGLARFVRIFQRKNVGKFQLANLSMKKLKDMGANAVGPRRKLMHAIDCLCEPSCFGAL